MRPAPLVLALLASAGCGGDKPSAPPPAPSEDGASTATPAPADGTGSGSPPAPADPSTSGVPSVSFERIDDAGDCAGLVPSSAPEPVVIEVDPAGGACGAGTSDGTGAIAIAVQGAGGATRFAVFGGDGAARGAFDAAPPLVPGPDGWRGLVVAREAGADPRLEHVAFTSSGAAARREPVSPDPATRTNPRWSLAGGPGGESVFVLASNTVAGNHWSIVDARRFDGAGAPRGAPVQVGTDDAPSEPTFLGGGLSTRGDALVVRQDSAFVDVTWLGPDGAVLAEGDRVDRAEDVVGPRPTHLLEVVPLLDGSVTVRSDGVYRRTYAHLATASSPLPAWLAERPTSTFRFTRGNAGYAAMQPPRQASADCTQRVDLLSASGRLCGRAVLREAGAACTTGWLDQGFDGTVVQQSARSACTYAVYPRLLGR